jgi:VIT1/CCC1 family predicted Fe2+/Mn2+ transporter
MKLSLYSQVIDDLRHHDQHDPHRQASGLADVILGGQDGLVNVLGIILGLAAATQNPWIVIVGGLAATFAESVSMGAVAFTSTLAEADYYESEREREYRHIQSVPALEKSEVFNIYKQKGFQGELLDRIVDTITATPDVWVAVMMAEEHQLTPVDRRNALKTALVVGFSAIVGSLIPLIPFALFEVGTSMWLSVLITIFVLFGVGAYKASKTIGHPLRSGLEMAAIGTASAMAGYAVGALLKIPLL